MVINFPVDITPLLYYVSISISTFMSTSSTSLEIVDIQPRPLGKISSNKLLKENGSKKQKLFVEFYLRRGPEYSSAYKCAIAAGYSESVAQNVHANILSSPWVQKELRRRRTEWLQNEERNTDWAREEVAILAGVNMADYLERDSRGNWQVTLDHCTREQLACIQELSYDVNGRPKIRLVDKKACVELHLRTNGALDSDLPGDESRDDLPDVQTMDSILRKVRQARQASSITINNQYNIVSQQRQDLPETIEAK